MKKTILLLAAVLAATNGFSAFKIVALPDTQNLSRYRPDVFVAPNY